MANWEEMTTECNFGEVNRNLLEAKNKLALLEAAKTNALFNKDKTMVARVAIQNDCIYDGSKWWRVGSRE